MHRRGVSLAVILGLMVMAGLWTATQIYASGFAFFEHGTRAMGMAGAFTAQADDPSAIFHNAGGFAFFGERRFSVGGTLVIIPHATFHGIDPVPGSSVTGEQKKLFFFPPHAYWVEPIHPKVKFGLGFNSPFGLTTKWKDPDNWAGRFISTKAELRALDLNPSLAWQITPKLGLGGGAIFRFSNLELLRRQSAPPPLAGREIGHVRLKSDTNTGYGWNLGLLHKATDRFSWGIMYRSRMTIDYSGAARFSDRRLTGIPPIDAGVSALIPFDTDLPITTSIKFPDMGSLGFAYAFTPSVLGEADVNWTGWHRFQRVDINFPQNPRLNSTIGEDWKSVFNYRGGLRWTANPRAEWRFGYFFDTTPQPEASVNPLLPDANRNGFSLGYGRSGGRLKIDLAAMYVHFNVRTTRINRDRFNGTYKTDTVLFGLTLNW